MPAPTANDLLQQGLALHRAGRLPEAQHFYQRVLAVEPGHAGALYTLAIVHIESGRPDDAIMCLREVIARHPQNAQAFNALGEAYRAKREGDLALEAYARAIAIDPRLFSAHNNRGIIEAQSGRMQNAIDAWQAALASLAGVAGSARDQSLTFNNLGNAWLDQGNLAAALEHHRKALALDPANTIFHSNVLRDLSHTDQITPEQILAEHRAFWPQHTANIRPLAHNNNRDSNRSLRIGLVSPDFREHSVLYFLTAIYEYFDRQQFSLFSYANVACPDHFTQWIADRSTAFRNILGLPDDHAAQLIQQDQIDILIDLAGHTAGNRPLLFAHQPAPIQIAYLGYPVTTGCPAIAWRITDADADPPGLTDPHFTEKLYRLPRPAWCYRPPPAAQTLPAIETPPSLRTAPAPFTFGSFNNFTKVTDNMIALWSHILRAAPASRLLLKATALRDDSVAATVRARFHAHGIDPARLLFAGKVRTVEEHLAHYHQIDLALDTFPYHGTTTTCEALWMNTPVLTLEGRTHISRVGVSLLKAVGLNNLIAPTPEAYITIATILAQNPEQLISHRKNLRQKLRASPLMNEKDFTQQFCAALRAIWQNWATQGR